MSNPPLKNDTCLVGGCSAYHSVAVIFSDNMQGHCIYHFTITGISWWALSPVYCAILFEAEEEVVNAALCFTDLLCKWESKRILIRSTLTDISYECWTNVRLDLDATYTLVGFTVLVLTSFIFPCVSVCKGNQTSLGWDSNSLILNRSFVVFLKCVCFNIVFRNELDVRRSDPGHVYFQ